MDDGALVFGLSDGNIGCFKFVTSLLQGAKKLPDIASFQALHIEEQLVHVRLCVCGFRCSQEGESIPLLFDYGVLIHVHGYLIGETLAEKALCNYIFALPSLGFLLLCIGGVGRVLGNRGLGRAFEVIPATSKYHCPAKTVGKSCPISNVRVQMWDVGK